MKKFVIGMIAFAVVCIGLIIISAAANSNHDSADGVIAAHTAPAKSKTTPKAISAPKVGDGTYAVGEDIKPGTYTTTVPQDTLNCYWSRMKDDTGDFTSIITNGNLAPGAHGRFTVKKTDGAVTLNGGCDWVKVSK